MSLLRLPFFVLLLLLNVACRKDKSSFILGTASSCNNKEMKLKRIQSTTDDRFYLSAEWNADGTIKALELNEMLSYGFNATYIYANGKIKEAEMRWIGKSDIDDTAVFVYNSEGKVDSIYMKNSQTTYGGNLKFIYIGGKLTKLKGYTGNEPEFYWDITTDANQNIIKAVEYYKSNTGYTKENTYTYKRDSRKNPLKNLAVYMFGLDDPYVIFRYWGANNYVEQRYEGHTDPVVDITTGFKYKYDGDCYPKSSMNTISGFSILNEDDWIYTYYP
jgi:hypothetical protein